MKKLQLLFCLAILIWALPNTTLEAQNEAPMYATVDYMNVKPGMGADYIKLEQIWKKLHQARINAGLMDAWMLQEVVLPYGTHAEYNYVTVNVFRGAKKLASHFDNVMPEGWEKLLTAEEVALVNRTGEIRDLVKSEVWQVQEVARTAQWVKGEVHVVNYFKTKEGFTGQDHGELERDIWMPLHKARIKDGKLKAWSLQSLSLPYGASMPYQNVTIDVYDNMEQFMAPADMEGYFAKVHPGKDANAMLAKTRAAAALMKGDIRRIVDVIGF